MLTIDLSLLKRMTIELQNCETQLRRERLMLEDAVSALTGIELEGMDQVRRDLRQRTERLDTYVRGMRGLYQALGKICESYEHSEERITGMAEGSSGSAGGFHSIDLGPISSMLF